MLTALETDRGQALGAADIGELPRLVGELRINDGAYRLKDRSVQPATTLSISNIETSLGPVDLRGEVPMRLQHASQVNRAKFTLDGSVLLKDPLQQLSLQMDLDGHLCRSFALLGSGDRA